MKHSQRQLKLPLGPVKTKAAATGKNSNTRWGTWGGGQESRCTYIVRYVCTQMRLNISVIVRCRWRRGRELVVGGARIGFGSGGVVGGTAIAAISFWTKAPRTQYLMMLLELFVLAVAMVSLCPQSTASTLPRCPSRTSCGSPGFLTSHTYAFDSVGTMLVIGQKQQTILYTVRAPVLPLRMNCASGLNAARIQKELLLCPL